MSDACGCGHDEPGTGDAEEREPEKFWQVGELRWAAVSGVFLVASWITGWTGGPELTVTVLELIAVVIAASTFVPDALRNLRHRRIGVGTLMTVAAIGSVALGQFAEAALLGILFSIAEGLEHYAVAKTRRGLRALLSLVPPKASVIRGGTELTVSPDELVIGDVMILRRGERAATDGTIAAGRTSLDLSAVTG